MKGLLSGSPFLYTDPRAPDLFPIGRRGGQYQKNGHSGKIPKK